MSAAKVARIDGVFFGFTPSSPKNGITNRPRNTKSANGPYGLLSRWIRNACSHGSWPYQITMYWDQNMYAQNTQKPKVIFPRSWNWGGTSAFSSPSVPRQITAVSAVNAIPPRNAPMKKYGPISVLNQCGSRDIT